MSNVSEQVSKAAESARETVAKVGESVSDFFQGNPFATPVGRKIGELLWIASTKTND